MKKCPRCEQPSPVLLYTARGDDVGFLCPSCVAEIAEGS